MEHDASKKLCGSSQNSSLWANKEQEHHNHLVVVVVEYVVTKSRQEEKIEQLDNDMLPVIDC